MAGKIKGITIEIGGNVAPLNKALESVNKKSRDIQSELRQVERLLKLDPKNTELVAQKQKLLAEAIGNTKEKLDTLKQAEAQVQAQFEKGDISEAQYRDFQREIIRTKSELKGMEDRLRSSSSKLESFGKKAKETSDKLKKVGDNVSKAGKTMTMSVTAPIAAGLGFAAKAGMDFEAQMSRVKAISGATASEFEQLNEQALALGSSTSFSASEVAQAQEGLASAGFDANKTMAAMPGLLDLAASSGADLATSTDIAASALNGFGLAASETGHVADVLAKNAAATNAAVTDTGEAMKYIAPVAKALGVDIESTTAAIGLMANAGIKGSQAGTTLRGALTNLAKPTGPARDAMKELGFEAFDATGKMLPLNEVIGRLEKSTEKLTGKQKAEVMAILFGKEAMSGMIALTEAGGDEMDRLTESYKNADGAAKEMATTMLDNTKGSVEAMNGSLETAAIKISQSLAPAIKTVADFVGKLADAFSNLTPGVQSTIVAIVGIIAVIGPLLMIIGGIISAVGTIGGAIAGVSGVIAGASGVIGVLSGALAAVGGVIMAVITSPLTLFVAAIAAVIAIVYVLNKNWDKISAGAKASLEAAKQTFVNFRDTVKGVIDSVVGFFRNIKLPAIKIPHIKLPHFSIQGQFSINPPSIPTLGVNWYKDGGIFNNPSIIGVGEAGREAVLPIDRLDSILASAMSKVGGGMSTVNHTGVITVKGVNNMGELVAVVEQNLAKKIMTDNRRIPNRASILGI